MMGQSLEASGSFCQKASMFAGLAHSASMAMEAFKTHHLFSKRQAMKTNQNIAKAINKAARPSMMTMANSLRTRIVRSKKNDTKLARRQWKQGKEN